MVLMCGNTISCDKSHKTNEGRWKLQTLIAPDIFYLSEPFFLKSMGLFVHPVAKTNRWQGQKKALRTRTIPKLFPSVEVKNTRPWVYITWYWVLCSKCIKPPYICDLFKGFAFKYYGNAIFSTAHTYQLASTTTIELGLLYCQLHVQFLVKTVWTT